MGDAGFYVASPLLGFALCFLEVFVFRRTTGGGHGQPQFPQSICGNACLNKGCLTRGVTPLGPIGLRFGMMRYCSVPDVFLCFCVFCGCFSLLFCSEFGGHCLSLRAENSAASEWVKGRGGGKGGAAAKPFFSHNQDLAAKLTQRSFRRRGAKHPRDGNRVEWGWS